MSDRRDEVTDFRMPTKRIIIGEGHESIAQMSYNRRWSMCGMINPVAVTPGLFAGWSNTQEVDGDSAVRSMGPGENIFPAYYGYDDDNDYIIVADWGLVPTKAYTSDDPKISICPTIDNSATGDTSPDPEADLHDSPITESITCTDPTWDAITGPITSAYPSGTKQWRTGDKLVVSNDNTEVYRQQGHTYNRYTYEGGHEEFSAIAWCESGTYLFPYPHSQNIPHVVYTRKTTASDFSTDPSGGFPYSGDNWAMLNPYFGGQSYGTKKLGWLGAVQHQITDDLVTHTWNNRTTIYDAQGTYSWAVHEHVIVDGKIICTYTQAQNHTQHDWNEVDGGEPQNETTPTAYSGEMIYRNWFGSYSRNTKLAEGHAVQESSTKDDVLMLAHSVCPNAMWGNGTPQPDPTRAVYGLTCQRTGVVTQTYNIDATLLGKTVDHVHPSLCLVKVQA